MTLFCCINGRHEALFLSLSLPHSKFNIQLFPWRKCILCVHIFFHKIKPREWNHRHSCLSLSFPPLFTFWMTVVDNDVSDFSWLSHQKKREAWLRSSPLLWYWFRSHVLFDVQSAGKTSCMILIIIVMKLEKKQGMSHHLQRKILKEHQRHVLTEGSRNFSPVEHNK